MWEQSFWLALRTKARGPLFQAFVNFADEQNPTGINITALGLSGFAADTTSVTGRIIQYSAAGIAALANQARATFLGATIATDYIGRYRAFVRYRVSAGADGDMRMTLTATTAGRSTVSDSLPLLNLGLWTVVDCGSFDIPIGQVPGATDRLDSFSFSVQIENTIAAARVADLMDLILLPSDEWLGYFSRDLAGDYLVAGDELHIDSATQPKHPLIAFEYEETSLLLQYQYVRYAAGPTILQSNPDTDGLQMWFFMSGEDSAAGTTEPIHSPTYAVRAEVEGAHRYLSMRGSR